MTKFEYVTFELGQCPTLAGKYAKANQDLKSYKKTDPEYKLIADIISSMKDAYTEKELAFNSDSQEEDYWVELLAKRSAVELITNGRVGYDTMNRMTCLSDSAFTSSVKRASIIASQLNDAVQKAEKSVESEDLVPKYLMD